MDSLAAVLPVAEAGGADSAKRQMPEFTSADLFDRLNRATTAELDEMAFGVVALGLDGTVEAYNAAEAKLAGLMPGRVIGRNFFTNVAPCTNNFMVAQRFETEANLDAIIDYVFTLRMKPQKVRLRMLKKSGVAQMYLVVERRV